MTLKYQHSLLFRLNPLAYQVYLWLYLFTWEWMGAGVLRGLQIRLAGTNTIRGEFDSHPFPQLINKRLRFGS